MIAASIYAILPAWYPLPELVMSILDIEPPATTTDANVPFQLESLATSVFVKILTLWNVPLLKPEVTEFNLPVAIPLKLWFCEKVIVDIPPDNDEIFDMVNPIPKFLVAKSFVSRVILFFKSLVSTSPNGLLKAKDFAESGLSSALSRSNWGYKSTTFWPYFKSLNSPDDVVTL